mmetsp:Transcript_762/g.1054  ORF Transcript_762/g.1054 Transcript_762/m.1054 type:complete len:106 (+) Transcript_762:1087-1404(+)
MCECMCMGVCLKSECHDDRESWVRCDAVWCNMVWYSLTYTHRGGNTILYYIAVKQKQHSVTPPTKEKKNARKVLQRERERRKRLNRGHTQVKANNQTTCTDVGSC